MKQYDVRVYAHFPDREVEYITLCEQDEDDQVHIVRFALAGVDGTRMPGVVANSAAEACELVLRKWKQPRRPVQL